MKKSTDFLGGNLQISMKSMDSAGVENIGVTFLGKWYFILIKSADFGKNCGFWIKTADFGHEIHQNPQFLFCNHEV